MLSEMVNKEENNRPTAGIRVAVPAHLKQTEKLLNEYGRRLRIKQRGTKHHVKYDDGEMCLYLNVKLRDEERWSRVYEEDAETWVKQLRREESARLNKKLNSADREEESSLRLLPQGLGPSRMGLMGGKSTTRSKKNNWTGGAEEEEEPMV